MISLLTPEDSLVIYNYSIKYDQDLRISKEFWAFEIASLPLAMTELSYTNFINLNNTCKINLSSFKSKISNYV